MGNCVRVHSSRDSPVKFRWSIGATKVDSETEIKENAGGFRSVNGELSLRNGSPAKSPEFSVSEELFLDSQPWLDSDNEDYFSVNGDGTPAHGGTPIGHDSFKGIARAEKPQFLESSVTSIDETSNSPSPSPGEVKKQLIELFHESFRDESINGGSEAKTFEFQLPPKSPEKGRDETRSETISDKGLRWLKGKTGQSAQCCLPNIARSLSYSEKKKKRPSYSDDINGGDR